MCDSGESPDVSVCHTVSTMTSPSVCQSHDLSVCQTRHDFTWKSVHLSVCLLSLLSIQPSAKFMVKIPMSITGQHFPKSNSQENSLLSVHHWICLSILQAVCESLCHHQLKTPSKLSSNLGEKTAANYMNEILVKHSLYFISYVCHCTHQCIVCSICPSIR